MKEVRESGLPRNFKNAARVYAQKIGERIEFDAIIVPSIFVQNAKKSGHASYAGTVRSRNSNIEAIPGES